MTKVDFYTGSPDKLRTACQLSHKAMQNGLRVALYAPDAATEDALDALLWHYPATAFIPHCRCQSPEAETMPVVLGHEETAFPHHELLINLRAECPPHFSRFERLIEIVGAHENDSRLGRERFRFYRDQGYEMRHFDLGASGNE
jgi:DNA polymerase-3 subunit chi